MQFSDTMILILTLLALVIIVLWIALPFAVFGIKGRLDRTNGLLADSLAEQKKMATEMVEFRRQLEVLTGQPSPSAASTAELIARRRRLEAEMNGGSGG